jgi:hypothetical protein
MRWEYRVVTVEKFLADMRYIGSDRWELVTISNDLVYFKRPLGDDGETQGAQNSREEAFALLTDLSKRDDPASQKAANFIRHTIGIANTIILFNMSAGISRAGMISLMIFLILNS